MSLTEVSEKTFFDPRILLQGGSEHMSRMTGVYNLEYSNGKNVFEAISTNVHPEEKLEAIAVLIETLDQIDQAEIDENSKRSYLSQFFLATDIRFAFFAMNDTEAVSASMQEFVKKLFELGHKYAGEVIKSDKKKIVGIFVDSAQDPFGNYERFHGSDAVIPIQRAKDMLDILKSIDPDIIQDVCDRKSFEF